MKTALLIDRDTILQKSDGEREFSYLIVMYGRPPLYGAVNRVNIDCQKSTSSALYSGFFENGKLTEFSQTNSPPAKLKNDALITQMAHAVCTEDWSGMTLLDVPADKIGVAAFSSVGAGGQ